jgi:hypothetical protein
MVGVDLVSAKDLLGHKSLTMTLRYAHLASGHKRKAVNNLDRLLQNRQYLESDHVVTKTDLPPKTDPVVKLVFRYIIGLRNRKIARWGRL